MAENLVKHMNAFDLTDSNSCMDYDTYKKLVEELQQTAGELRAIANRMAGYRDLPMGRHNQNAMTHPKVREAFEKFVKQKQELLSLMEQTTERDNQLLEMMYSQSQ